MIEIKNCRWDHADAMMISIRLGDPASDPDAIMVRMQDGRLVRYIRDERAGEAQEAAAGPAPERGEG